MNKGLANLNVIERKRAEETAFADWVAKDQAGALNMARS